MEERLQKFVRLVEIGSFTKAAMELHISQPALTVAMGKLERELGVEIIVKGSRPLELTEAGKIAYRAGVAQAVALDNLRTDLNTITESRPEAHIGMIDSVAAILSAYTEPLSDLKNDADVSIIVNNSRYLRTAVAERRLDCAVVIADKKQPTVSESHLGDELMVLVSSPQMVAEKQGELERGVLTDFICYDQQSKTYDLIVDGLASRGISVDTRLQSSSPEVICRMVISGTGVAMLPYFMVRGHLVTDALVVMLNTDGAPVTQIQKLVLATPSGKKQPSSIAGFIERVGRVINESYKEAEKAIVQKTQKRRHG